MMKHLDPTHQQTQSSFTKIDRESIPVIRHSWSKGTKSTLSLTNHGRCRIVRDGMTYCRINRSHIPKGHQGPAWLSSCPEENLIVSTRIGFTVIRPSRNLSRATRPFLLLSIISSDRRGHSKQEFHEGSSNGIRQSTASDIERPKFQSRYLCISRHQTSKRRSRRSSMWKRRRSTVWCRSSVV